MLEDTIAYLYPCRNNAVEVGMESKGIQRKRKIAGRYLLANKRRYIPCFHW